MKYVLTILGGRYYLQSYKMEGNDVKTKFTTKKSKKLLNFETETDADIFINMHGLEGFEIDEVILNE